MLAEVSPGLSTILSGFVRRARALATCRLSQSDQGFYADPYSV